MKKLLYLIVFIASVGWCAGNIIVDQGGGGGTIRVESGSSSGGSGGGVTVFPTTSTILANVGMFASTLTVTSLQHDGAFLFTETTSSDVITDSAYFKVDNLNKFLYSGLSVNVGGPTSGVQMYSGYFGPTGILNILGYGNTNNEGLAIDLETEADKATITSLTSISTVAFSGMKIDAQGGLNVVSTQTVVAPDSRSLIKFGVTDLPSGGGFGPQVAYPYIYSRSNVDGSDVSSFRILSSTHSDNFATGRLGDVEWYSTPGVTPSFSWVINGDGGAIATTSLGLERSSFTISGGTLIVSALTCSSGQVLTANASGVVSCTSAGGSPSGPTNAIQFENAGSFDGDSDFTFDPSGRVFAVGLNTYFTDAPMTNAIGGANIIIGTTTIQNVLGNTPITVDNTGLIINSGQSGVTNLYVYDNSAVPIIWTDFANQTITFGDDFDLGGSYGFVARTTLDDTIRIRQLVGQTGNLTTWQSSGLGQVAAMSPSGVLTLGSSTGLSLSGSGGTLTMAGIGGSNNENLLINLESTSNTAVFTSGTGVTALSFSGMGLSGSSFTGSTIMTDNVGATFGSGSDVRLEFDSTEANDTFKMATAVPNSANNSGLIMITDNSGISTNYGVASSTYPQLRIQSVTGASNQAFMQMGHDATDANLRFGVGRFNMVNVSSETVVRVSSNAVNMLIHSSGTFSVFGVAGSSQQAAIANASGGATIDTEARTALNQVLTALRRWGYVAP